MSTRAQHILLVDDSQVNRLVAEAKLSDSGFLVTSATNGREALDLLDLEASAEEGRPRFDAILLDVMMPEIDGREVLKIIRQTWSAIQLPVLMATARNTPEDVVESLKLGANDYITKPINLPVLLARLEAHLELKRSHETLRKAQHSLMSAARTESTALLAAGVAHEIRNPLAQIQMAVGGLRDLPELVPEEKRKIATFSIDTIETAIAGADTIVQQLMRASQAQQLDLREADLNEVVDYGLRLIGDEILDAGVSLKLDLGADLPKVRIAEDEFFQALIAVITNALQAMARLDPGERCLQIRTESLVVEGIGSAEGTRSGNRVRDGDQVVALHVEDSGSGMKPEDLEVAFDAFYTTRATGAGTGLGLTVVRKIVQLHGGLVRLANREAPESGLRVSILLRTFGSLTTSV